MENRIIAFAGQMMAGKTVAAKYLVEELNKKGGRWIKVAFADGVKKIYADALDVDLEFIEEWKRREDCPPKCNQNVRHSLMFIGDGFRENICHSIWIDKLFRDYSKDNIVIDDVRYRSEVDAIKERGGINIAVWRKDMCNSVNHPSEAQLKPEIDRLVNGNKSDIFDYLLLNDGDVNNLRKKVIHDLVECVSEKQG